MKKWKFKAPTQAGVNRLRKKRLLLHPQVIWIKGLTKALRNLTMII